MLYWRKIDPTRLHPGFVETVEAVLLASPYHWYVTHGYRSLTEQGELYRKHLAGGPRAAPPGKSAHNYGLAIDVVLDADPDTPGLQPSWNTKLGGWLWLKGALTNHPMLKSGWTFADWPHIEMRGWADIARRS
jgi:hypothetical protein